MSASIAQIPFADNAAPDVLGFGSKLAALLTQRQQTTQAEQATQGGALNLARQRYGLSMVPGFQDALAGVPGAPAAIGGASALAPAMGSGGGGGGGPASAQPQTGLGPQTANTMYGVPLPPLQAMAVFSAKDPDAALKAAQDGRRTRLYELASSGLPWDQAVTMGYQEGYLDAPTASTLLGHEDKRPQFVQALASPEALMSLRAAGYRAGVTPNAQGGEDVSQPIVAAGGAKEYGQTQNRLAAEAGLPAPVAAPRAASLADPNTPLTPTAYAGLVTGAENAGGAPNATNSRSSATGNSQFIDGTWQSLMAKYRPDLTAGKTPAQVLALRSDAGLSAEMAVNYARDNAPVLAQEWLPVNAATLGIAHRFGPEGAKAVLSAPANTPMAQLVTPDVLAANPELRGQTAGAVVRSMVGKYGVAPVAFGGTQGVPPTPPAAAQAGAPPAAAPLPAGTVPSAALVAQQKATAEQGAKIAAVGPTEAAKMPYTVAIGQEQADRPLADEAQSAVDRGIAGKAQVLQFRDAAADLGTGAGGTWRGNLANYVTTLIPGAAGDRVAATITGMDPSKAQEAAKYALQQVTSFEKESQPRGGYNVTKLLTGALPGLDTQPDPLKHMANYIAVAHQLEVDANQGATQFYQDQSNGLKNPSADGKVSYQPMATYYEKFNDQFPAEVGIAAGKALSGDPLEGWSKGLKNEQQADVLRLAWRTDPSAIINGHRNPALAQ